MFVVKSMKILVTGAGLIGAYTAAELVKRGHQVSVIDIDPDFSYLRAVVGVAVDEIVADLTNLEGLRKVLVNHSFDAIVHTAGLLKDRVLENQHRAFEVNVCGSASIGQIAIEKSVPHLILLSSVAVYGPNVAGDHVTEEVRYAPESLYGLTKVLVEQWLTGIYRESQLGLTILRPAGVYGPGQFRGGAWMGRQLQEFVFSGMRQHSDAVSIEEDVLGTNEYLYVKDLASAIALSITSEALRPSINIMNIGADRIYSTPDVCAVLNENFKTAGFHYKPATKPLPDFQMLKTPLVIDRAKELLGYRPEYGDLAKGCGDFAQEIARLVVPLG